MSRESRIQYHKDCIKRLETYEVSYRLDYFKIFLLIMIAGLLL